MELLWMWMLQGLTTTTSMPLLEEVLPQSVSYNQPIYSAPLFEHELSFILSFLMINVDKAKDYLTQKYIRLIIFSKTFRNISISYFSWPFDFILIEELAKQETMLLTSKTFRILVMPGYDCFPLFNQITFYYMKAFFEYFSWYVHSPICTSR